MRCVRSCDEIVLLQIILCNLSILFFITIVFCDRCDFWVELLLMCLCVYIECDMGWVVDVSDICIDVGMIIVIYYCCGIFNKLIDDSGVSE